jgi:cytochrome P450
LIKAPFEQIESNLMTAPADPITAVTHPDPYPYYADLAARKQIHRDEALGLWIASSADAVTSVLNSDRCRVRPATEPVPKSLLGSPAADIFRHLVRMTDGARHCPFKQAVSTTLASVDADDAAERTEQWAKLLLQNSETEPQASRLNDFIFRLPVYVVASLLGVPQDRVEQSALWVGQFTGALAPGSKPGKIEQGKIAAGHLLNTFHSLLAAQQTEPGGELLIMLAREAKRIGKKDTHAIIANAIGFLSQTYEATAGLIGNTLLVLASQPDVLDQIKADPGLLAGAVDEVLRYDSPVQNTRRFLVQDGVVAGQRMQAGDAILVVLAAANRDPSFNSRPDRFDMLREDRRVFSFGAGVHACPGEPLASVIAQAAIQQLIAADLNFAQLSKTITYRDSVNTRVPLFARNDR